MILVDMIFCKISIDTELKLTESVENIKNYRNRQIHNIDKIKTTYSVKISHLS